MAALGDKRVDLVLEPVTGKALPVYKGETLRITQLEGGQCVDFNCYNLHDYKEYMSVGVMRRQGMRVREGHFVWSNPPRFRPMMVVIAMPKTCVTDMLAPRCNGAMLEIMFGFETHTNCTDTFTEAVGEYGLTPDDLHDSLNMWMNTGLTADGQSTYSWNTARKGDHVDLLALTDVLAVPIVCGSGDVLLTSNFALKPIGVEVFERTEEIDGKVEELVSEYVSLKNQRTLDDYRVREIRTERELKPVPGYEPKFPSYPLEFTEIPLELTEEDRERLEYLRNQRYPGSDEEVVLAAVMSWYLENRRNKTWDVYRGGLKPQVE